MQVCTSLQTGNHASTPSLSFYRPDVAQPTASKHWRHTVMVIGNMQKCGKDCICISRDMIVDRHTNITILHSPIGGWSKWNRLTVKQYLFKTLSGMEVMHFFSTPNFKKSCTLPSLNGISHCVMSTSINNDGRLQPINGHIAKLS